MLENSHKFKQLIRILYDREDVGDGDNEFVHFQHDGGSQV